MENPLVSICCVTYNHAPYIRQCLDGFIMQKTTFNIEILIHDDASTDETADIIREYEFKYPDIIKPIYQKENQYSKGIKVSFTYNFPRAKGKYIAMCEGDDYWTDPYKLQKQVDFLESHPDYSICSHRYRVFYECEKKQGEVLPEKVESITYDLDDYIHGFWATQPLTCLFLKSALDFSKIKIPYGKDFSLFFSILSKGKGFLSDDIMGEYRIHSEGIWSKLGVNSRLIGNIRTIKSVCDAYQNSKSIEWLYLYLKENNSQFSFSFITSYWRELLPCWKIVAHQFGYFRTFMIIIHQLHLKKKLMFWK